MHIGFRCGHVMRTVYRKACNFQGIGRACGLRPSDPCGPLRSAGLTVGILAPVRVQDPMYVSYPLWASDPVQPPDPMRSRSPEAFSSPEDKGISRLPPCGSRMENFPARAHMGSRMRTGSEDRGGCKSAAKIGPSVEPQGFRNPVREIVRMGSGSRTGLEDRTVRFMGPYGLPIPTDPCGPLI